MIFFVFGPIWSHSDRIVQSKRSSNWHWLFFIHPAHHSQNSTYMGRVGPSLNCHCTARAASLVFPGRVSMWGRGELLPKKRGKLSNIYSHTLSFSFSSSITLIVVCMYVGERHTKTLVCNASPTPNAIDLNWPSPHLSLYQSSWAEKSTPR